MLIASPFVGLGVAWLWSDPLATAQETRLRDSETVAEQYNITFAECSGAPRINCVIDGDTFWLNGEKVRIADINAPEVSEPQCAKEAQLGAKATQRLVALLNEDSFSLESADRDEDGYGRKLRIVTRRGNSLGDTLVDEGLAERWKGYRGSWC